MSLNPWKLLVKESPPGRPAGLLAGMRIRKKLIVLHTSFSLVLASILVIALRPAVGKVVASAEIDEAKLLLRTLYPSYLPNMQAVTPLTPVDLPNVRIRRGTAAEFQLDSQIAAAARSNPGEVFPAVIPGEGNGAIAYLAGTGGEPGLFVGLSVIIPEARDAVWRLYVLTALTLFGVYALIAIALELFVLPRSVYSPIQTMLRAEEAVRERRVSEELIPADEIPADELGEIMKARNQTISSLRANEAALADALKQLEAAAGDLKKKNHLLEAAQRNLADADRLASLGTMSAGIAHELNTPLSVLTGLAEKLNAAKDGSPALNPEEAALLLRVVRRIERLSDSLLDFARVRPPITTLAILRTLVDEALTLVRLDRDASSIEFTIDVPRDLMLWCDTDRIVQVLVNLSRNAVDALSKLPPNVQPNPPREISIRAVLQQREGTPWLSIEIADNGPGIDASILPRLFEPFNSTRMDAKGTGLGLAVSEGIIKEHGGLLLARNRPTTDGKTGAVFEILLPCHQPDAVV